MQKNPTCVFRHHIHWRSGETRAIPPYEGSIIGRGNFNYPKPSRLQLRKPAYEKRFGCPVISPGKGAPTPKIGYYNHCMDNKKIFGTIEGGGTKFICAVADEQNNILREIRIPTTLPQPTLAACADFFLQAQRDFGELTALGIACFGPLDPRPTSSTYGQILATPKPGWESTDVVGFFRATLGADLPIGFDTDVNGAVLAESRWGAGQGFGNLVYLTIGTGIGGGALVDGQLLHGYAHPEMGHMLLAQHPSDYHFAGNCPFHGTCLEGLASGPAIEARWNQKAANLAPDHPAWQLEAHYLALGLMNICLILAPERIILGGGVMNQSFLFPMIRSELTHLLGNYLSLPQIAEMESYVVPSGLAGIAGLYGGLALAHQALQKQK